MNYVDSLTNDQESVKPPIILAVQKYGLGFGAFIICLLSFISFLRPSISNGNNIEGSNVFDPLQGRHDLNSISFDKKDRYTMNNYDKQKPMSNFLAGLGGLWGVPMWAFYVNRGQGITSFGMQNKDGAISKFNTAEKAYQQTPFTGFRTFVKGSRGYGETKFTHMPFYPTASTDGSCQNIQRDMMIGSNEMEIQEIQSSLNLQTNVLYFTITDEDFPALVRKTTFKNLDSRQNLHLDVLDGLGRLIPAGLGNWALDAMGRTMEAWMNVYNTKNDVITQPFFHISQGTADTAVVQIIKDGYFSLAFVEDGREEGSSHLAEPLPFVVDPSNVFNTDTTLTDPAGFFAPDAPGVEDFVKLPQGTTSRTPCAFAGAKLNLTPGGSASIVSVYGHAASLDEFLQKISPIILAKGFVENKRAAAASLVDSITQKVKTSTSSSLFDSYIKQDFLDNVLRGGLPIKIGGDENNSYPPKIYHTFSRIHGDIERDYNNFQIDTTYFSQGPGNFRDVNQNRRLDVFHTPSVGDFNVRMFLSFVQADGYNPLTVATTNFKVPPDAVKQLVQTLEIVEENDESINKSANADRLEAILAKPFRIGQLFSDMKAASIVSRLDRADFLNKVVGAAEQDSAAQYAQNGFWADHWTYTLDLVENYLSIFPDKEASLLWDSKPLPFFMSPAIVKPRHSRYSLVANPLKPSESTVRVYNAISAWGDKDFPETRKNAMNDIFSDPSYVADSGGAGGVWQRSEAGQVFLVSPLTKLAMLGILKFSTLDSYGMGVEMEGGKPGWNDAMNGLPGILGSGMPETYEMIRILRFVRDAVTNHQRAISFPLEFATMIDSLVVALDTYESSTKDLVADFNYWDASNMAREIYRDAVVATFSGSMRTYDADSFIAILKKMISKADCGVARALTFDGGLSPTYFSYESEGYKIIPPVPQSDPTLPPPATQVTVSSFKLHTLPRFLEGPTRHLKIIDDIDERRKVYQLTKESTLYDKALKMFTISESLVGMGQDVGRMMAFSPGWLENQSVWLHMSYKFYLELLRGGLYQEFFAEILTGLVPFMDNKVYGRSPLEAASFIVSSAFPDPKLHGASFLARLSGSTAEFLSMWALMMAGHEPFSIDPVTGELVLALRPLLPGWLFTEDKGIVQFTFLGNVQVTYHNTRRIDTWNSAPVKATIVFNDETALVDVDAVIKGDVAHKVRNLEAKSIDLYF